MQAELVGDALLVRVDLTPSHQEHASAMLVKSVEVHVGSEKENFKTDLKMISRMLTQL